MIFKILDINECTTELSECEQNCINTDGSFRCDCNHGYILGSDESSCKGDEYFIFLRTQKKMLFMIHSI